MYTGIKRTETFSWEDGPWRSKKPLQCATYPAYKAWTTSLVPPLFNARLPHEAVIMHLKKVVLYQSVRKHCGATSLQTDHGLILTTIHDAYAGVGTVARWYRRELHICTETAHCMFPTGTKLKLTSSRGLQKQTMQLLYSWLKVKSKLLNARTTFGNIWRLLWFQGLANDQVYP